MIQFLRKIVRCNQLLHLAKQTWILDEPCQKQLL